VEIKRKLELYPFVEAVRFFQDIGDKETSEKIRELIYDIQDALYPKWRDVEIKAITKDETKSTENSWCYVYPQHPAIRQINGYYETLFCTFGWCNSWYEKYHQQYHSYCGSHMREVYYYDKRWAAGQRIVQWGEYCSNCGWAYGPFYRWYQG
jgi:hypothetical protein